MLTRLWHRLYTASSTQAYFILDELLLAGELQETSKKAVTRVIEAQVRGLAGSAHTLLCLGLARPALEARIRCLLITLLQRGARRRSGAESPCLPLPLTVSADVKLPSASIVPTAAAGPPLQDQLVEQVKAGNVNEDGSLAASFAGPRG